MRFINTTVIFLLAITVVMFHPFIFQGLLPIPADSLVGLYHPFRDLLSPEFPNGIPFKNFLITDPIRQIIPWKELSMSILSVGTLPTWNPYEMAGKPLIGNMQSAVWYPLNVLLFIKPFAVGWSLFIYTQILLAVVCMYAFLNRLKLHPFAVILGTTAWIFSGFIVAWLEWGTVVSTVLWMPLLLYGVDRFFSESILKKKLILIVLLALAFAVSFFAGHLQSFFYVSILVVLYTIVMYPKKLLDVKNLGLMILGAGMFLVVTIVQWVPAYRFITLSARMVDQSDWKRSEWFIPWEHLIQFLVPDFFGNPTTLNYWGTWNYAEFVGYVGVIPFIFALLAIIFVRNRVTLFFSGVIVGVLIFAFPNSLSQLPFEHQIPFLASSQPTRLIMLACFSLAVLSAYGFHHILEYRNTSRKAIVVTLGLTVLMYIFVVVMALRVEAVFHVIEELKEVAFRNSVFPVLILLSTIFLLFVYFFVRNPRVQRYSIVMLLFLTVIDLLRFFYKFQSFSDQSYFYPQTPALEYIQQQPGVFRVASLDSRILPSNVATWYRIQSVEGYDPLYLKSYAELVIAIQRGKPDVSPPYGFNRILEPRNINSPLFNLLQVKYVLSYGETNDSRLKKVFQEGSTHVYEYTNVLPRVFFVQNTVHITDPEERIAFLSSGNYNVTAVVEDPLEKTAFSTGSATVESYSSNEIIIKTTNSDDGFLVILDTYYPSWHAYVDGKETKIFKTNHTFRGIVVPKGTHTVQLKDTLL